MDPFPYPWLFAVLGGAIILGLFLAYGAYKSSTATRRQKQAAERGAQRIYEEEKSES